MESPIYHIPALLEDSIKGLNINPNGVYVDVTFGGGGHSRAIMSQLGEGGRLLSFDQDLDAYANRLEDNRFTFVHSNFAFLKNFVRYYGHSQIDGLLADLGVSFHHFDSEERGFSFRHDSRLDMRMNLSSGVDASTVVNTYSEEQLSNVLYLYGELKQSRRMASAIVKARADHEIITTGELVEIVSPYIRRSQEKKELAQVFQALRIEVNHEIDALKRLLEQSAEVLKPGGRLVIITYHSLEDRLVKNFMRSGNLEGKIEKDFYGRVNTPWKLINNKVITASEEEVAANPRSRSAKLRIAEKIG
ncbi:MAG: 16S rRNA (cytosine(1402)-N(4))-methyltransferase RsmH [Muribaculaceae bacterium]|nr:16S rRNA (cytosine(1402)-N(4))-methyltransferase RsmH [Muribaculaceae bacterium]